MNAVYVMEMDIRKIVSMDLVNKWIALEFAIIMEGLLPIALPMNVI